MVKGESQKERKLGRETYIKIPFKKRPTVKESLGQRKRRNEKEVYS